jgi:excisionase family DNA binding protein
MRLLESNYTRKEAAEILRVSVRAIGDFLKKGILIRGKLSRSCVSRMGIVHALGIKNPYEKFQILRVKEVAEQVGRCVNSVYRYYEEGRIPCIKLGKTSRFFQKDVDEFLRSRKQGL